MEKKAKVPKLRFPGFTGEWEERKLGEIGTTFSGLSGKTKDDFGHGDGRFITYMNIYSNPIADIQGIDSVEIDKKQNQVKYGDVLFTMSSETPAEVGMSSVWCGNKTNTYLNSFCFGYRPKIEIELFYLAYLLRSPIVRKKLIYLAQGISRYNISKNRVMDINISLPSFSEQEKIGGFFRNFDDCITLYQRKLTHLQAKKKCLLQKMFPKKGERFPELRFPGFTNAWEQKKLGNLVSIKSGQPPSEFEIGQVLYVKVDDLNHSVREQTHSQMLVSDNEHASKVSRGSIIFPKRGAAIMTNKVRIMTVDGYIDTNMMALEPKNIYGNFLYVVIDRIGLYKIADTSTIPQINNKHIEPYEITLPKTDEQQEIGEFFKSLDNLIILHERKLAHLQTQKKALLQQMFV